MKIKNLIFVLVMLIGISGITLAYSQGDIISAGVSGYTAATNEGRNNAVTATGIDAIPGVTAAVSYTGSAKNPDLKYGTVVYVESTGKSYVINDVGSKKRGGSIGVEPFCNTKNETYSITTPNGSPTNVKILYVPNEGSVQANVKAGLAYLNSGATANKNNNTKSKNAESKTNTSTSTVNNSNPSKKITEADIMAYMEQVALYENIPKSVPNNNLINNVLYKDLANNHWAYEDIKAMKNAGVVSGRADGTIAPDEEITAEEFLALLSRVVKLKNLPKAAGSSYLEDYMKDRWSNSDYIALTKVLGKISGETVELGKKEIKKILGNELANQTVLSTGPNALLDMKIISNYEKAITREKAAYIMGVFGFEGATSTNVLKANDWDKVNSEYRKRINGLIEKNIFRGAQNDDGTISVNPQKGITRAEAIALMNRLYKAL